MIRYLEDDGHDIQVLDVYGNDLLQAEVEDYLDNYSFEAVAITGFGTINYLYVLWLAEQIKKRCAVPIVVGGLLANYHYDLLLSKGTIDYCVVGEGEETSRELFRHIDDPNRLPDIQGIAYRKNGTISINPLRPLIEDLDSLPMPNFDLWPMERYTQAKMYAHDQTTAFKSYEVALDIDPSELRPNMTFLSGRGCPYKCTYCSRSYNSLRLKSVDRVIEELEFVKERYGIKAAHFADETLLLGKKRIFEFCERIKDVGIYWDGQGRVNTLNREIMIVLKDANCLSVGLGVESGSDTMLKTMKKGITRRQTLEVLKAAKDVGLHLKIQLMGGYPGETKRTLRETATLMKEADLPPRRLTWCTPLPGSELYGMVTAQGLIEDEEAYIVKLQKGYNNRDYIAMNVSGQTDKAMIRLFDWVHLKMDFNYFVSMLLHPRTHPGIGLWKVWLKRVGRSVAIYYVPGLYFRYSAWRRRKLAERKLTSGSTT
ncbi:MAG: B12-binding domain-containing radical SAM protein [Anaerolineae bacterium]|nr:B12-binding domain-containing radical SAM protein [Anaerolineae bacterium]